MKFYLFLDGGEKQLIDVHNKSADEILSLVELAAAATERYFYITHFLILFIVKRSQVNMCLLLLYIGAVVT